MTDVASFPPLHTVHLKECNVNFAYNDSGAPQSLDYTTVVCIHGHTHHAQTFGRLFTPAARRNIRVIALNRRDYVGSTPFSEVELAALSSPDEFRHRQFLYDRGLEIAYFLLWVINELKIPRTGRDGKAGGLALLGWSLGNITSFAFLANLERYPVEVVRALEPYLKHFFIYEAVYQFVGFPAPPGAYHPLWDDEIAKEEKAYAIDVWFAAYYRHPYFSQHPDTRVRELSSLQLRAPRAPLKPPTIANKTPEDDMATKDTAPAMRSEIWFFVNFRDQTLYEQYKAALIRENGSGKSTFSLPNLRVSTVDGTETVWNIIWTTWGIEKDIGKWKAAGAAVRPIEFISIEGSNHFLTWDNPELMIETLAGCLTGKGKPCAFSDASMIAVTSRY